MEEQKNHSFFARARRHMHRFLVIGGIVGITLTGTFSIFARGEGIFGSAEYFKRYDLLTNGLVAHWTMDGADIDLSQNSSEIRDISGYNHGDWRNHASTTAPGVLGQAVEFDGYNDDMSMGSPASLDNLSNFTYAAWIRVDSYASNFMPIMGKGVSRGANATKRFLVNSSGGCTGGDGSTDGCIEFTINTTGSDRWAMTPAGTIKLGLWYHVAAVYTSGSAPKIYVNGTEASYLNQSVGSGSDEDESSGTFLIGSWDHDGSRPTGDRFNGLIDDARVYNRALSAAEIQELYRHGQQQHRVEIQSKPIALHISLSTNLVAHWTMDGADIDLSQNSAEIRDISGYNHGDWRNHASTTAPGMLGQGIELDGVNDYINAGNDTSLNFTGAFTVAAWVRTTVPQQNANIVAKHRSDYMYGPWRLQTDAGLQGTQFKMTIGNSSNQEWNAMGPDLASNDGRWVHVVGVFRPSTAVELWVDGNLEAQNTSGIPSSIPTVTNPLIIGARHTAGGSIDEYFAGYLDDVRIYNRALSAAEIQELYRLGR
ncbi:MAG: hypothetical protein KatS3mg099_314 [Candidatus Parcubacteria bacterium]|nr:MAG: hypothetical protein KatS3mg099_314 [Candidatus Parcubacteria bacterium]